MLKVRSFYRSRKSSGFSLFEVLVSGLIVILCFLLVLQSTSISAFSKAKAQESKQVLDWIQQDVEFLRYQATTHQLTTLMADVAKGATSIAVVASQDFKEGDQFRLSAATGDATLYQVADSNSKGGSGSGKGSGKGGGSDDNQKGSIAFSPPLAEDYRKSDVVAITADKVTTVNKVTGSKNETVHVESAEGIQTDSEIQFDPAKDPTVYQVLNTSEKTIKLKEGPVTALLPGAGVNVLRCAAKSPETGLADGLRDKLAGGDFKGISTAFTLDTTKTKTSTGKQFKVQRVLSLVENPPFNLLQISYSVTDSEGKPGPIETFITRLLPEVAFHCQ
jgi:hypothetical protein